MKNSKKISKNVGNLGSLNRDYIVREQNRTNNFFTGENCTVANPNLIVNQFKKKVRLSLYNLRIDIHRKEKYLRTKEFLTEQPFLTEKEGLYDEYKFVENEILVLDFKMTVKNDLLYEVLNAMEQTHRDIIYMSLCEKMSDQQIGKKLNLSRSKVQRIKQKIKNEIYEAMSGGLKNEDKSEE